MDRRWTWLQLSNTGLFQAILVVLYLVHKGRQTSASSASWNRDDAVVVRKGDDLSVTCTVFGIHKFLGVVRIVHTQGLKSHLISENAVLKSPFSQIPRYNVTYEYLNNSALVTLTYLGIQPEDGGRLDCHGLGGAEGNNTLNVTVLVEVNDLYVVAISSDGSETPADDKTVFLEENENLGVGCIAVMDGSAQAPEVHVMIDGSDVMSSFQSTTNTTLVLLESGLSLFKSQTRVVLVTSQPDITYNGKEFKCSVEQKSGLIEASAVLSVRFTPVIECNNLEKQAKVGDHVTFGCNVKANPSSEIKWEFATESSDKLTEHKNIIFNKSDVYGDSVHVEMTITQINDLQFCRYLLTAVNEIGTANVTFELLRVAGPVGNQSLNPDLESNNHGNPEESQLGHNPDIHVANVGVDQFRCSGFMLSLLTMTMASGFCFL